MSAVERSARLEEKSGREIALEEEIEALRKIIAFKAESKALWKKHEQTKIEIWQLEEHRTRREVALFESYGTMPMARVGVCWSEGTWPMEKTFRSEIELEIPTIRGLYEMAEIQAKLGSEWGGPLAQQKLDQRVREEKKEKEQWSSAGGAVPPLEQEARASTLPVLNQSRNPRPKETMSRSNEEQWS